jgi:hypothetical protein
MVANLQPEFTNSKINMKKLIMTGVVLMTMAVNVVSQNHLAMLYSSAGMEYGKVNAVDNDTNYINGALFQNTINVNPDGTFNLTAPGATTQVAITKYNKHGELLWAFHVGGTTTSEAPHGIGCDINNNIYVTGYFGSTTLTGPQTASFNPLGGGNVSTQGNEDCFVAKYGADGSYQWAFGLGNTGQNTQERAWDICVEPGGNFYVAGGFHGTMNFNPLGTTMNYSLPDTLAGLFIAKYNSDGICQWVISLDAQTTSVFNEGYATCDADGSGNLYIAGNFRGNNINFNPLGTASLLGSSGLCDIFIGKYDTGNGVLSWIKKVGSTAQDIVSPGALRCDNNGNPCFTGRLSGTNTVNFDPNGGTANVSNSALYLASFDPAGNLRFAEGFNSGAGDGGHRVAFDNQNNVYMAGWMNGTVNFGNGINLTACSPTADVFLSKFTNSGDCIWAFNFGGIGSTANNICAGLSVDQENNPIITGQLYGTSADIDPGSGVLYLSSAGNNDCFVIKYTGSGQLWVNDTTSVGLGNYNHDHSNKLLLYPNPSSMVIHVRGISIDNQTRFEIINSQGKPAHSGILPDQFIDISFLPEGIYFIRIDGHPDHFTKKFVIERQ